MRTQIFNTLKSIPGLDAQQVINKLTLEIEELQGWAMEKGDGTSQLFYDKMKLLNDKIEERDKIREQLKSE